MVVRHVADACVAGKLLAYLSGEREASLRRSVAVLQRMLQLFVEVGAGQKKAVDGEDDCVWGV